MKVAIIGATGNAGTALLTALREEPAVTDILGIARRYPDRHTPPYDIASWERADVAVPVPDDAAEDRVIDHLARLLRGVDTVVHLAWLIQPNRQRDLLRRANVEGTRRVVEACLRARVSHLVAASSVGAYTGVDDDERRDESWPTDGIPTSHYSVDKAAQERVLDDAVEAGLAVARLRPALIFDAAAGAEVTRLFLGALIPTPLLHPGALPVLPWPAGLRLQVVHGADVADAYRRVIRTRATGAFNIATEPLLHGPDIAEILAHGHLVNVPAGALRPMLSLAWQGHVVAADPGWLDMGMEVPVMDTTRARTELGWQPEHEASETVREMLSAMARGHGAASPQMRTRQEWPQDQAPPGAVRPDALISPGPDTEAHRVPVHLERAVLGLYLADHLSGATAGVARMQRMAQAYADTELGDTLAELATHLQAERDFLRDLINSLELRQRPHRQAAAWIAERMGRLKTNARPTGSPMTPLLELEIMRSAVIGKLGGWQTLASYAADLGLPPEVFTALAAQARAQADTLEDLHATVAGAAFR